MKTLTISPSRVRLPAIRHSLLAYAWGLLGVILFLAAGHSLRAAEPIVNLSANQLEFPAQAQGTGSPPQVLLLSNSGEADLSINGIAITGENNTDFAQTNNCPIVPATLAPRARCEIRVAFTPTVTGTLTAALNVTDNASGSPQSVNLTGLSTAPGPLASFSPHSLIFASQTQGTSSPVLVIVLTNTGSETLSINSEISINGPASDEFHIQAVKNSCPAGTSQLAPKTSCQIAVQFAPTTAGVKSAQILIVDDAAGSPHSIELSGTATPPQDTPKSNP